jgi:hypothetical protein
LRAAPLHGQWPALQKRRQATRLPYNEEGG